MSAWITTNTPKLAQAIAAGNISVEAETDESAGVERVRISFDIAGTSGDRKRLLAVSAGSLRWYASNAVPESADTYSVEKDKARNWAQWLEKFL